jgi:hypothetical protein
VLERAAWNEPVLILWGCLVWSKRTVYVHGSEESGLCCFRCQS